jgi:uncharacterized protein YqjF (DUF2071 family)
MAHWETPAEPLQARLGEQIQIDTWHGRAWVSAVAFCLNTRPIGWPSVPLCSNLLELNLRTYVRSGAEPAVCFLSMHGNRRLAVWLGRRLTPLPYAFAPIRSRQNDARRSFICGTDDRRLFEATYRPLGAALPASVGSLDSWLLERYTAIVPGSGQQFRMTVEHPAWVVQSAIARVSARGLGLSCGLDLERVPDLVHFSAGVSARVGASEIQRASGRA